MDRHREERDRIDRDNHIIVGREPDRPLLLMLGSSRADCAFQAGRVNDLPGPGGKPYLAYNFGVPAAGLVAFSDPDVNDQHSATFVAENNGQHTDGTSYLGRFQLLPFGEAAGDGGAPWEFNVSPSDIAFLAKGQTLQQFYNGIPVEGGSVTMQKAGPTTVSAFGTVYSDISIDTTPAIAAIDAARIIEKEANAFIAFGASPTLVIVPSPVGTFAFSTAAPTTAAIAPPIDHIAWNDAMIGRP